MAKELADPNRPIQRRFWLVERIGWAVLTLILIWALAGGAGGGVLAERRLQAAGVEVTYDRFARKGAQTPIEIQWPASPGRDLSISFDAAFVDLMKIDFVRYGVQPVRAGDAVTITVARPSEPGRLLLHAHPVGIGTSSSAIRIGDQQVGRMEIFVFP